MHIHSHNFIHANVHYLIASTTCTHAHMHTYTYTHMHTYGQFPAVSGMDSEVGPFRTETGYENKEGEVHTCV